MKNLIGAILGVALMAGGAVADVSIIKPNIKMKIDCAKDPNVSIAGSNAKVTLTGTCESVSIAGNNAAITGSVKSLTIAGNNNKLELTSVDNVTIAGNNNKVAYKGTVDSTLTAPVISNVGNQNSVSARATK